MNKKEDEKNNENKENKENKEKENELPVLRTETSKKMDDEMKLINNMFENVISQFLDKFDQLLLLLFYGQSFHPYHETNLPW